MYLMVDRTSCSVRRDSLAHLNMNAPHRRIKKKPFFVIWIGALAFDTKMKSLMFTAPKHQIDSGLRAIRRRDRKLPHHAIPNRLQRTDVVHSLPHKLSEQEALLIQRVRRQLFIRIDFWVFDCHQLNAAHGFVRNATIKLSAQMAI